VKLVAALQLARLDARVGIFQANRAMANAIGLNGLKLKSTFSYKK
jgi:hypothetical protein